MGYIQHGLMPSVSQRAEKLISCRNQFLASINSNPGNQYEYCGGHQMSGLTQEETWTKTGIWQTFLYTNRDVFQR